LALFLLVLYFCLQLSGKQKRQGIGVSSTEEQEGQGCHIILCLSGVASLYIL
jgi:hypothetical protein